MKLQARAHRSGIRVALALTVAAVPMVMAAGAASAEAPADGTAVSAPNLQYVHDGYWHWVHCDRDHEYWRPACHPEWGGWTEQLPETGSF
ncbi:hypothetical protein [Nocardia sp. NPDC006630]|uniref:hypothetical protein n=1 Tax=unclassified Nocardia TaxID=2637762 RepID=UPI0032557613